MGSDVRLLKCRPAWSAALLVAFVGIGCRNSPARWRVFKPPTISPTTTAAIEPYRVGVGDVLAITSGESSESTQATVEVDGCIRLDGMTPLPVDGRSLAEIESSLSTTRPSRVEVSQYASQVVHVSGVLDKGAAMAVAYRGPETVQNLIERVGCKDCVQGYRVRVVRPSRQVGGEPEIFSMEFDETGRNRDALDEPLGVSAGDFVYVDKDFGRKGPLTLLTDQRFRTRPTNWMKKIRFNRSTAP